MTPKELGKLAQDTFERVWLEVHGKSVYLHRFTDTSDIRARYQGKTIAHLPAQPADYHVTVGENAEYAEVKGTSNQTGFSFSALEASQLAAMKRVHTAGGHYWVYIFSLYMNLWYRIPPAFILGGIITEAHKTFNFKKDGPNWLWEIGNKHGRL